MFYQGVIQQLRGQNFAIFSTLPMRGQFLYPERGQKPTFFNPLPPHLVNVVIVWPPNIVPIIKVTTLQIW